MDVNKLSLEQLFVKSKQFFKLAVREQKFRFYIRLVAALTSPLLSNLTDQHSLKGQGRAHSPSAHSAMRCHTECFVVQSASAVTNGNLRILKANCVGQN